MSNRVFRCGLSFESNDPFKGLNCFIWGTLDGLLSSTIGYLEFLRRKAISFFSFNLSQSLFSSVFRALIISIVVRNEYIDSLDGSSATAPSKTLMKSKSIMPRSYGFNERNIPSSSSRLYGMIGVSSEAHYWLTNCSGRQ